MPKIDAPVATSPTQEAPKRWVEIPLRDLYDFPHPTVRINLMEFKPGEKYYIDAQTADFIEDRLKAKFDADVRAMRPNQDHISQNAMNRYGVGARTGGHSANPSEFGG